MQNNITDSPGKKIDGYTQKAKQKSIGFKLVIFTCKKVE